MPLITDNDSRNSRTIFVPAGIESGLRTRHTRLSYPGYLGRLAQFESGFRDDWCQVWIEDQADLSYPDYLDRLAPFDPGSALIGAGPGSKTAATHFRFRTIFSGWLSSIRPTATTVTRRGSVTTRTPARYPTTWPTVKSLLPSAFWSMHCRFPPLPPPTCTYRFFVPISRGIATPRQFRAVQLHPSAWVGTAP